MKQLRYGKCRFSIDDEGWTEIYDGQTTAGLPEDEAKALWEYLSQYFQPAMSTPSPLKEAP